MGTRTGFWTLAHISLLLQLMLVVLVIAVLAVSIRLAQDRVITAELQAEMAERAAVDSQESVETIICILLAHLDGRDHDSAVHECGLAP